MKRFTTIGIVLLSLFAFWYYRTNPLSAKIRIGNQTFSVDLALSEPEKERGLGYRDVLPQNAGMLFVFDHKDQYPFWMKGMRFPLDILWIDDANVVDITTNVPIATSTSLPLYAPRVPVNKVLEVNAGVVARTGISVGDDVEILN